MRIPLIIILILSCTVPNHAQWQNYLSVGPEYSWLTEGSELGGVGIGMAVNFKMTPQQRTSVDHMIAMSYVKDDFVNTILSYTLNLNINLSPLTSVQMGPYGSYNMTALVEEFIDLKGDLGLSMSLDFSHDPLSLRLLYRHGLRSVGKELADAPIKYHRTLGILVGIRID